MVEKIKNVLTENNVEFAEMADSELTQLSIKLGDITECTNNLAKTYLRLSFNDGIVSMMLSCYVTTNVSELVILRAVNEYNKAKSTALTIDKFIDSEYSITFINSFIWSDDFDLVSIVTMAEKIHASLTDFISNSDLRSRIDKFIVGESGDIYIVVMEHEDEIYDVSVRCGDDWITMPLK